MKFLKIALLALPLLGFAACGSEEVTSTPTPTTDPLDNTKPRFILAVNSLQDATEYTLEATEIEGKTFDIKQNFMEMPVKYYTWIFHKQYGMGMSYQGAENPGLGYLLARGADGKTQQLGEFVVQSRFTNYEFLNDSLFVTSVGGQISADGKRDDGATFEFWAIKPEGMRLIRRKTIWTKDISETGEQVTFSGLVPDGSGGFYTSMIKSGHRAIGANLGGSSVGTVGSPDSCWVAQMDTALRIHRIFKSDKQSYAAGQYRAMNLRSLLAAEDGTIYAFSNGMNTATKHPASALRLHRGATDFDADYYFNIQQASGGFKFRRVWPAGGHRFLLELYNTVNVDVMAPGHDFAIVDMQAKTLRRIEGLPAKGSIVSGSESGGVPCYYEGAIYLPISTAGNNATIYKVDPVTATSKLITTIVGAKELRSIGVLR